MPEHLVTKADKRAFRYVVPIYVVSGPGGRMGKDKETVVTFKPGFPRGRKNGRYYGFHRGNLPKLERLFGDLKWVDKRVDVPIREDLEWEFTSTLRPEQKEAVDEWMKHKFGVLQAPTRWGKAVAMVWIAVKLRQRCLILMHTTNLVQQFYEECHKHTNTEDIEAALGQELIGVATDDWSQVPYPLITLSTYQSFVGEHGKERRKAMRKSFGMVWLTECHMVPAQCLAHVFSSFWARVRGGDTATPERKDQRHHLAYDIIGPITAVSDKEQLHVRVRYVMTGITVPKKLGWGQMWKFLVESDERNQLILKRIAWDADRGRSVVAITERVWHAQWLAQQLAKAGYPAEAVFGGNNNEAVFEKARSGETQIVVAVSKCIQHGLTIAPWDTLHHLLPIANEPVYTQRVGRIRTPYTDKDGKSRKKMPLVRDYMDSGHGAVIATYYTRRKVYDNLDFDVVDLKAGLKEQINADRKASFATRQWGRGKKKGGKR